MTRAGNALMGAAAFVDRAAFVGRVRERELLRAGLASAAQGRPGLLLVAGEAGVGKTRLLAEFEPWVREAGGRLLVGSCVAIGNGGLPYGPVVAALRDLSREMGADRVAELAGPLGADLGRLFSRTGPAPSPDGRSGQGRLFEGVLALLDGLADQGPVVLVLEDLQWADRTSLDLLTFLSASRRRERLLLVGTYRSDGLHRRHRLRPLLAELLRHDRTTLLELAPLDGEETGALLAGLPEPPSAELARLVYERSEGNAFFALELASAGAPAGARLPPTLADVLLVRVTALSEDAQEAVRVAAVVGREVGHRLLATVTGLPDRRLLGALREAVDGAVLTCDARGGQYAFRHGLLQEAVCADLLPGERTALHSAVARALNDDATLSRGSGPVPAAELAHHWYAAHDLARALPAGVAAGRAAAAVYAFAEAQRQFERALESWDRVPDAEEHCGCNHDTVVMLAADAARWAGDTARAVALVRRALAANDRDPGTTGSLQERLGRFLWEAGDTSGSAAAYAAASATLSGQPPSALHAQVLAAQGAALMLQAQYRAARQRCEAAIATARAVGAVQEEGHASNTLGVVLGMTGDAEGGIAALLDARRLAEQTGDLEDLTRAYNNLSFLLTNLGRLADGLRVALDGLAITRAYGLEATAGAVLVCNAGATLFLLGRWDEAAELLHGALERSMPPGFVPFVLETLAELAVARGEADQARSHLATVRSLSEKLDEPQLAGPLAAAHAELALWGHDHARARAAVAAALPLLTGEYDQLATRLCALGVRAEADEAARLRLRGAAADLSEVTAVAGALRERADQLVCGQAADRQCVAEVRAHAALCEAELSRLGSAPRPAAWAEVAAQWEVLCQPYQVAYARFRQAEACLLDHRPKEAAAPLRSAEEIAARLRATPLLQAVQLLAGRGRIDLTAAPDPVTAPRSPADRAGLTSREREVLGELVAGRSNRQIARRLFITEKTASVHVSNILGKLGATNRGEAAAAALVRQLVPAPSAERQGSPA